MSLVPRICTYSGSELPAGSAHSLSITQVHIGAILETHNNPYWRALHPRAAPLSLSLSLSLSSSMLSLSVLMPRASESEAVSVCHRNRERVALPSFLSSFLPPSPLSFIIPQWAGGRLEIAPTAQAGPLYFKTALLPFSPEVLRDRQFKT